MGMMIPGRSCSAEGVVRRVAVGPSRSEIAPLHFSVAIAGSACAGIAAYHRTRIADAIVIAAAARELESQLTTTFAAHALGCGPARRYAIYGSAAPSGCTTGSLHRGFFLKLAVLHLILCTYPSVNFDRGNRTRGFKVKSRAI